MAGKYWRVGMAKADLAELIYSKVGLCPEESLKMVGFVIMIEFFFRFRVEVNRNLSHDSSSWKNKVLLKKL
jgi:hypothetical protein